MDSRFVVCIHLKIYHFVVLTSAAANTILHTYSKQR